MTSQHLLQALLLRISNEGSIPVDEWPRGELTPSDLGLVESDRSLRWPAPLDLLDRETLAGRLEGFDTKVFHAIDSTNSELLRDGESASVDHRLYVAEFQYGGRGRRGRAWLSPYGRNLAMSLGMVTTREMTRLGGLSSVIGVALAAAFEQAGVKDVTLKWPNDVLVDDKKICGILIELVQRGTRVEYVVGIGVNVDLTEAEMAQIDQPVTDLRVAGVTMGRTDLVVHIIATVARYLAHFEVEGFQSFIEPFNLLHKFHNRACRVVAGREVIHGTARGIGGSGELILETPRGRERFHGGEVSLRPDDK